MGKLIYLIATKNGETKNEEVLSRAEMLDDIEKLKTIYHFNSNCLYHLNGDIDLNLLTNRTKVTGKFVNTV